MKAVNKRRETTFILAGEVIKMIEPAAEMV